MDERSLEQQLQDCKKELEDLKKKYNFFYAALENLPNPIFIKNEDAKFVFFNKRYADFFGMERAKYLGKDVYALDYLSIEDRARYQMEDLRLIESSSILSYEVDFDAADGEIHPSFYWSKGIIDPFSNQKWLIGEIVDISKEKDLQKSLNSSLNDLKEINLKLEHMAEVDPATGIYNRLYLNKLIEHGYGKQVKRLTPTCMLLLDLDHFKSVNDTFGHLIGDEMLIRFANILRTISRENDVPIRYGGDEFLLILNDVNLELGKEIAERIRSTCESEIALPDGSPLTTSIGVAEIHDNEDIESIISRLDIRLYAAKNRGCNCVVAEEL
ncbi:MAG: GGDEF domain-containing protein [Solobacterium sp.]|nr:GGDEF domain-containing protein [Solobacterium sp.]